MSLINKMLQDLDARGTPGAQSELGHVQIRAIAARPAVGRRLFDYWPQMLLAVLILLVLLAAAAFAWRQMHAPKRMPPPAQPAPVAPAAPAKVAAAQAGAQAALKASGQAAAGVQASGQGAAKSAAATAPAAAPTAAAAVAPGPVSGPVSSPVAGTALAAGTKVPPTQKPALPHAPGLRSPASATARTAEAAVIANIKLQGKELTSAQRAESEYRHATTYLQQGRVTEAIISLNQALQIEPGHDAARQTLVGLLLEAQRTDEAMQRLQEGLARNLNQPELAMLLARLYVDKNDVRSALEVLQKSEAGAQGRADYLAFQGALLQRDKRHKEAAERYTAALRLKPANGVWWMGLGISLQADGRTAEAREAFTRAKNSRTLSAELLSFVEQKITQLAHTQ